MSRLNLDPSTLQVESFGPEPVIAQPKEPKTYPDCPTATGCTCIPECQSVVQPVCPVLPATSACIK